MCCRKSLGSLRGRWAGTVGGAAGYDGLSATTASHQQRVSLLSSQPQTQAEDHQGMCESSIESAPNTSRRSSRYVPVFHRVSPKHKQIVKVCASLPSRQPQTQADRQGMCQAFIEAARHLGLQLGLSKQGMTLDWCLCRGCLGAVCSHFNHEHVPNLYNGVAGCVLRVSYV